MATKYARDSQYLPQHVVSLFHGHLKIQDFLPFSVGTYGFVLLHCQKSYGRENPLSAPLKGACSIPFFAPDAGRLSKATLSRAICTVIMTSACASKAPE